MGADGQPHQVDTGPYAHGGAGHNQLGAISEPGIGDSSYGAGFGAVSRGASMNQTNPSAIQQYYQQMNQNKPAHQSTYRDSLAGTSQAAAPAAKKV